jgi:hypothetical protein
MTLNAAEGVTAAEAAWKLDGVDNSIWEIVHHLNFYVFAYVERFKGIAYVYPTDNNDETFRAPDAASEDEWSVEIERFKTTMSEFRDLISAADDGKFDQSVSASNPAKWSTLIANINAHNAHHGGQIMLLRKLQGTWDRTQGVS